MFPTMWRGSVDVLNDHGAFGGLGGEEMEEVGWGGKEGLEGFMIMRIY